MRYQMARPNSFNHWDYEHRSPTAVQPIKCDHSKRHYHWRNTSEYQMEYCPVCSHIRNFWFKSFWKRLKSLFKNETL